MLDYNISCKEYFMENNGPIYALNLFDIIDREEYLAYSKRSAHEGDGTWGKSGGTGPVS